MTNTSTYRIGALLLAVGLLAPFGRASGQTANPTRHAVLKQRADTIHNTKVLLEGELLVHRGWSAWWAETKSFRDALRAKREDARVANESVIRGHNGFVFLREWETSYFLETQINSASNNRVISTVVNLSNQLASHNIDLIIVPVPSRIEVYPDYIAEAQGTLAPHARKLLLALSRRDVEVVDLLRVFESARDDDVEPLYHKIDPHWSSRGIQLTAKALASRLARYGFDTEDEANKIDLTFVEQHVPGIPHRFMDDLDESVSERWSVLHVQHEDGSPYVPDENSPVLVIGDSFVGHFEDGEMRGGIGSHLACELGLSVDTFWRNAAGPFIPRLLRGKEADFIEKRRVIIWILAGQAFVATPESLNRIWAPVKLW